MLSLTTITATIFCITIVATYLSVRVRRVSISNALVVGFVINALAFFVFAVARDNSLFQALFVALLQSAMFTVASVAMGVFFRGDAQEPVVEDVHPVVYSGEQLSTAA